MIETWHESKFRWATVSAAFVIMVASQLAGGTPGLSMRGGGVSPEPPATSRPQWKPNSPVDLLSPPLYVAVVGQASSYTVVVTNPSGAIVATGTTNAQGMIQLNVPPIIGLELDVLDTTVVGLPVAAGQAILITIP